MRVIVSTAVTVGLVVAAMGAQAPAQKPGPEQKRIGFFAGHWNFQGEAKQSPLGPAGKITGTESCEWFAGGFTLVCRTKVTGPKGPGTGMSVMGYDAARKMNTYHAISSHGDNIFVRGNVDGKVWTWSDEMTMDGKAMKIRATITEETPTSTSFKLEASVDNGPMMVVEEGKSTKQKAGT